MKPAAKGISYLALIVASTLLISCSNNTEGTESTRLSEDFADQIIAYEHSILDTKMEPFGAIVSSSDKHTIITYNSPSWRLKLKDFDNTNPHQSIKLIMSDLIAFAAKNKMAVRDQSWSIHTYGPSDEIEPYNNAASFYYQGAGTRGSSVARHDSKNCKDRYIQATLVFGHLENTSFIYSWNLTYDVVEKRVRLNNHLHSAHPVSSPLHGRHLVNLTIK